MLSTNRLRSIYSKIQTQLFYMIPEKWDRIYLYASVIEQVNHLETGEMFFYYYPAGLLKKNPVNVYEIPNKFNIEEEEYTKLINKLYDTVNELRRAFKESTEEKMWSNFTITIQNSIFKIEYNYEDLLGSEYTSYDRHLIWMCKYLGYSIERFSKKDKKMLKEYFENNTQNELKTKIYSEGMYKKKVHNIIEYKNEYINTDEIIQEEQEEQQKKENINNTENKNEKKYNNYEVKNNRAKQKNNKKDKYEQYKEKKDIKKQIENNKKNEFEKNQEPIAKNQILNF